MGDPRVVADSSTPRDQRIVAGYLVEEFVAPGLVAVTPPKRSDARGFLSETYSRRRFLELGIDADFVQDNHTYTAEANTIRGLHFQSSPHEQGKLVRALCGAVLDVVVDIRQGSPAFGVPIAVELSAENWRQLYVPPGFAHGFCSLTPDVEIHYRMTAYYAPDFDFGVAFDDPDLMIGWPVAPTTAKLSERDKRHPRLRDLPTIFSYKATL